MKTTTRKTEMRPVKIALICVCGAVMVPTGRSRATAPTTYHHQCTTCDRVAWELKRYPYIDHEPLYVPKENPCRPSNE